MRYRCIKSFSSSRVDDDGFQTGKYSVIDACTLWTLNNEYFPGINHLDRNGEWCEVTDDFLQSHFEPVEDGENNDN